MKFTVLFYTLVQLFCSMCPRMIAAIYLDRISVTDPHACVRRLLPLRLLPLRCFGRAISSLYPELCESAVCSVSFSLLFMQQRIHH